MDQTRGNTRRATDADEYKEIQDSLPIPYHPSELKEGDLIEVNAGIIPKLVFMITETRKEAGQPIASGKYGCFAVDLLIRQGTK